MTTFSYSSGDPTNLTGGATADMSDISGPFSDLSTFLNGNITATNVTDGGLDHDTLDSTTVAAKLGLSQTGTVRRGKSIIATEESRTNTSYGTMTTPDQVSSVVLPTDGLIFIAYKALWKESVDGAALAAIFIGANQLKIAAPSGAPVVQEPTCTGAANTYAHLCTNSQGGLTSGGGSTAVGSDVTTGQAIYNGVSSGGFVSIFAAAGTYDVSVQFKASSGSVTAKERKLWVWTIGF